MDMGPLQLWLYDVVCLLLTQVELHLNQKSLSNKANQMNHMLQVFHDFRIVFVGSESGLNLEPSSCCRQTLLQTLWPPTAVINP